MDPSQSAAPAGPDVPRAANEFRAVVELLRPLTPDIMHVRLALSQPPRIDFRPGQTIRLKVPASAIPPQRSSQREIARTYSIANPPEEDRCVELCVRHVPGGVGSGWIFHALREGDEVRFTGPLGRFFGKEFASESSPVVWIAGGSGVSPFWSMLRHMKLRGLERPCRLFLGAATPRDLALREELRQMERELSWFRFIPVVVEAAAGEPWDGPTGLVTEEVDRQVSAGDASEVYVCGPPGLIDAAVTMLTAKGFPAERIFLDKFAFAPRPT